MRKLITGYIILMAAVFGLILILGNAHPALAQGVRDGAALVQAVPKADGGSIDLSGLQPYWDQVQLLLQPVAAGLPIVLLIWLTVNALVWADLIKNDADAGTKKRRWALGSGIVFGLYAALHALAASTLPAAVLPLILAILDGIIRGVAAGVVAALLYEGGSALLQRGSTTS